MGWFGLAKQTTYVVAVVYEGPGRLRLNANRVEGGRIKQNAARHEQTVIWMEVTSGGGRVDQGTGPSASRLPANELEKVQRDVPLSPAFKAVVEELDGGRNHASKWYKLGTK